MKLLKALLAGCLLATILSCGGGGVPTISGYSVQLIYSDLLSGQYTYTTADEDGSVYLIERGTSNHVVWKDGVITNLDLTGVPNLTGGVYSSSGSNLTYQCLDQGVQRLFVGHAGAWTEIVMQDPNNGNAPAQLLEPVMLNAEGKVVYSFTSSPTPTGYITMLWDPLTQTSTVVNIPHPHEFSREGVVSGGTDHIGSNEDPTPVLYKNSTVIPLHDLQHNVSTALCTNISGTTQLTNNRFFRNGQYFSLPVYPEDPSYDDGATQFVDDQEFFYGTRNPIVTVGNHPDVHSYVLMNGLWFQLDSLVPSDCPYDIDRLVMVMKTGRIICEGHLKGQPQSTVLLALNAQ